MLPGALHGPGMMSVMFHIPFPRMSIKPASAEREVGEHSPWEGRTGTAALGEQGLFCRSFPDLGKGKAWRAGSLCCFYLPSAFTSAPKGRASLRGQGSGTLTPIRYAKCQAPVCTQSHPSLSASLWAKTLSPPHLQVRRLRPRAQGPKKPRGGMQTRPWTV